MGYRPAGMCFAESNIVRLNAVIVVAVLHVGAAPVARCQSPAPVSKLPAYRQRLLGVFDERTGEPIEGAEVSDALNRVTALTTRTGTVTLAFLPDGGTLVQIKKVGYQPRSLIVEISPSDTVPLTLTLTPLAQASSQGVQTLPAVVTKDSAPRYISPGLQAFEERRKDGGGYFITEAELRKHDYDKMTNIIRRLPGITMSCPRKGPQQFECHAVSGRQNAKHIFSGDECAVDLYVDGVESTSNDLEQLPVNEFAAVEFYPGGASIPIQYNRTGSSCGVLLFWTRER